MTKAELYALVEEDRRRFGVGDGAVDAVSLSRGLGYDVEYVDFKTRGLRGIALVENNLTLLNSRLSAQQQNFYACHELFHHIYHRNLSVSNFQCYDMTVMGTAYYEWEANEGAAELLVPYKNFLRVIGRRKIGSYSQLHALQKDIARVCKVPLATAALRFDSLKFELQQYLDGIPIERIQLMSGTEQEESGIRVASFNELYRK